MCVYHAVPPLSSCLYIRRSYSIIHAYHDCCKTLVFTHILLSWMQSYTHDHTAVATYSSRYIQQSLHTIVTAYSSRYIQQSLHAVVATYSSRYNSSRYMQQSLHTVVATYSSRYIQQSLHTIVATYSSRYLQQSLHTVVTIYSSHYIQQSLHTVVATYNSCSVACSTSCLGAVDVSFVRIFRYSFQSGNRRFKYISQWESYSYEAIALDLLSRQG